MFGSNGQEKANYSLGVLERFTRRAVNNENSNPFCKTIFDTRKVNFIYSPHCAHYFEEFYAVNSNNEIQRNPEHVQPMHVNKIVINHYHCKSWEEYQIKNKRGDAYFNAVKYTRKCFEEHDCNDEFDDGILKYRAERAKNFKLPDKSHADERLFNALVANLSPTLLPNTPPEFYAGKMETFLTCRAVAAYLQTKLTDAAPAKFFEEAAIKAILKSINQMTFSDARLLIKELPNLLTLPYPAVEELRVACLHILPQTINILGMNKLWKDYVELDYIQRLLQIQK